MGPSVYFKGVLMNIVIFKIDQMIKDVADSDRLAENYDPNLHSSPQLKAHSLRSHQPCFQKQLLYK